MTEFERKVYAAVKKIPRGRVSTYHAVARAIGKPRAYRAVGNALNKNPHRDVPCHRVICSDGDIGGFVWGRRAKRRLLGKEGIKVSVERIEQGRVRFFVQ